MSSAIKSFRTIVLFLCFQVTVFNSSAQDSLRYFHPDSLRSIVEFLAADSLKGRGNFSSSIEKAAKYISQHFNNAGLFYFSNLPGFYQPFIPGFTKLRNNEQLLLNGSIQRPSSYFFSSAYEIVPNISREDFKIIELNDLSPAAVKLINDSLHKSPKPLLVIVPSANKDLLYTLKKNEFVTPHHSLLIIASDDKMVNVEVYVSEETRGRLLFNVIGVLPGKLIPEEIVLITAHYDHVGMNSAFDDGIFNGANDNASGTTAMLTMSKYFSSIQNNRTIVFIAFAGEEFGLLGSKHLAPLINAKSVVAMFNLEMLGKPHSRGKRTLIITGREHSDMDRIMKKHCKTIKFSPDIWTEEQLFKRSDNYPFALKGIPAHTFMCFTEDDEDYHQPSDEIDKIDFKNFSELLKGLIPGIEAVVSGIETPKRIRL